ncbi:hypothetical protein PSCT_03106 [Pseudomonas sp. SCT]|uniref:hypothetical protein n=1 Tax=Pseudomonas sp. (strain SCT) TaxID=412955 RepID=UPI000ED5EB10|nr:hypothetical protein [Pseudomonas sp. SCT]GCA56897.1 hypothetical protein PSCT_03106 [Pseudomonas sp. SCT]
MDKEKSLSIIKVFKDFPLAEYAELAIDTSLDNEVLSSVPVISTAHGIYKTFKSFKKVKLRKKVNAFLEAASNDVNDEDSTNFAARLSDEERAEFLEEILDAIDSAESDQKAAIIGTSLRRLIKGDIEYGVFKDQIQLTNYIKLSTIHMFMHAHHNSYTLTDHLGDELVAHRIVKRKIEMVEVKPFGLSQPAESKINVSFEITNIGHCYLETLHIAYKDKIDKEHLVV